MTPDQQRVAIAEACGWTWIRTLPYDDACYGEASGQLVGHQTNSIIEEIIPDFPFDLNAMHQAESYLSTVLDTNGELTDAYESHLIKVGRHRGWPVWYSTAAQRAEAFLRTVGRWEG